ncbi:MAG: hypothetical protein VYE73_16030, partial [Acidobacteriota bacterium]|nr:hypothetical protein [Acidobacteriota bacterium]
MNQKQAASRFEQVVMVAVPPRVEQRFTSAVRKALGKVEVIRLEEADLSNGLPDLDRSVVVMAHGMGDMDAVAALNSLRNRGVGAGVLLLANGRSQGLEEELVGLAPVSTFSVSSFRKTALVNCLKSLSAEVKAVASDDGDG